MDKTKIGELIKWNRFAGSSSSIKPELRKRFLDTVEALEELLALRLVND